jgi:hypothetical protein
MVSTQLNQLPNIKINFMGKNNSKEHINEVMNNEISKSEPLSNAQELRKKADVSDQSAYIIADPYTANPSRLLGKVIEVRKVDGQCPTNISVQQSNFEFSPFSVKGFEIDDQTKASKPELRGSFIVDKTVSAEVGFLNFLSGQLDSKSTFSLVVMDQARGIVIDDDKWDQALRMWMEEHSDRMEDSNICYIYVVTGFIQKNIIKKRYVQFETGARGGAYGINVNGKLATSTEDYSLDVIFGLTAAILKRPNQQKEFIMNRESFRATDKEKILFAQATGKKLEE